MEACKQVLPMLTEIERLCAKTVRPVPLRAGISAECLIPSRSLTTVKELARLLLCSYMILA
jgi:hypothetical protein